MAERGHFPKDSNPTTLPLNSVTHCSKRILNLLPNSMINMKISNGLNFCLGLLALGSAVFACKKDSEAEQSTLHVRLTDAPTAFQEVNVDIREVRVKFFGDENEENWVVMPTHARIYNLLGLQGGVDTVLAIGNLPRQEVKQIRFILGPNNSIKEDGVLYPLTIPSGSESGLKIKISKKLNATLETLVIDFDTDLSVKKEGNGDYKLRPVIKVK